MLSLRLRHAVPVMKFRPFTNKVYSLPLILSLLNLPKTLVFHP